MAIELDTDNNGAIDIALGGTNAKTAAGARANLGISASVADYTAARALTGLSDGQSVSVAYRSDFGDNGGGVFLYREGNFTSEVSSDTRNGIYLALDLDPTGASGVLQRMVGDSVTPGMFGALTTGDAKDAILAALDSGFWVDGVGKTYQVETDLVTTASTVRVRNLALSVGSARVDLSSASDLQIENLSIDGRWDGTSPVAYDSSGYIFEAVRVGDGTARANVFSVSNYNGGAFRFQGYARVDIDGVSVSDCAYGGRIYDVLSGAVNNVNVKRVRRIGLTVQSSTNATDHDDISLSNVSIDTVLPGIGTGQDLHGIGLEIHNFVDEALATNIRVRNTHSMGLSLSGCEHGRVSNVFIRDVGYTSESASEATLRGYAAIEIVDSDAAYVEGTIIDSYQTFVRFDKSHFAHSKISGHQDNATVSGNFRFLRFQGTADNENNAAWSCRTTGSEFRNNTGAALKFLDIGLFGTFGDYRHNIGESTIYDAVVDSIASFNLDGLRIESSGAIDDGVTAQSLLDLVDAGDDIQLFNVEYIGINSGSLPYAFARVSSASINRLALFGCKVRGCQYIVAAASGTLAELTMNGTIYDSITDIYSGTISSAFRLRGDSNIGLGTRNQYIPETRKGNSISGVTAIAGDVMWKRGASAGISPGWMYNGTSWVTFPVMV